MTTSADVTSAVLFVTELDRSVDFYSGVLGCSVSIREDEAALLLTSGGFQLYLIAKGGRATQRSAGVGDQYLLWGAPDDAALDAIVAALRSRDAYVDTHRSASITFVEGRDPDGTKFFVAHPRPDQAPRTVIDGRFFN